MNRNLLKENIAFHFGVEKDGGDARNKRFLWHEAFHCSKMTLLIIILNSHFSISVLQLRYCFSVV